MPLSELQREILLLLASHRNPESLTSYTEHAGRRGGYWPSSSEIGGIMARHDGLKPGKFPQAIMDVYGPALTKFLKNVEKVERDASPISVVTKAVEHALTARHPRTRYPVGKGISFVSALSRALPDKLMDRVIAGPA